MTNYVACSCSVYSVNGSSSQSSKPARLKLTLPLNINQIIFKLCICAQVYGPIRKAKNSLQNDIKAKLSTCSTYSFQSFALVLQNVSCRQHTPNVSSLPLKLFYIYQKGVGLIKSSHNQRNLLSGLQKVSRLFGITFLRGRLSSFCRCENRKWT